MKKHNNSLKGYNDHLIRDGNYSSKGNRTVLWKMSHAPQLGQDYHFFQMVPIIFFSAIVILIVRMASYDRPMQQFYWAGPSDLLTDFFSYGKMVAIISVGIFAGLVILYRFFSQSFVIKRTVLYAPLLVYVAFVVLSHVFSDYKEFSLFGWNDRFEGTLTLLAYTLMFFYVFNTVNTEKTVKLYLYAVAVSSSLLGILGVSQALDKDFFRTVIGQKLITPNAMLESGITLHQHIAKLAAEGQLALNFTFQNKEIYQTVYNINYVSFYLTLLIPVFGLLFIRAILKGKEEPMRGKIIYGGIFGLLLFNLIGSASSGGFLGMAVVVGVAILLFNKKIITWWKPVIALFLITIVVGGITYERWSEELEKTFKSIKTSEIAIDAEMETGDLNFIRTEGNDIFIGYNDDVIIFTTYPEDPSSLSIRDGKGESLMLEKTNNTQIFAISKEPFQTITVKPGKDKNNTPHLIIGIDASEWIFRTQEGGVQYLNGVGKLVSLETIPAVGFINNQSFGSGRGYIWSRTIPMLKDTILVGRGADTYCAYFPHNDYVGKYNSGTFSQQRDIIVDKPHNMYMGMWVGTGMISFLSFLIMVGIYIVQSCRIFRKKELSTFLDYSGAGIFLGILGFLSAGLVNDSSVSVMPLFYSMLGVGLAVNMMLTDRTEIYSN